MSNHTIGIINAFALIIVSSLLYFSYKVKRKNKSKTMAVADFKETFELQDQIIYHSSQAIAVFATLLHNMSEIITTKQLTSKATSDVGTAFKEVAYRINDQVSNEKSNYVYSLIVGDCFTDTKNCLLVLNKIIQDSSTVAVPDIVQGFKLSVASQV